MPPAQSTGVRLVSHLSRRYSHITEPRPQALSCGGPGVIVYRQVVIVCGQGLPFSPQGTRKKPTVARRNEGLEGLLQAISEVARGETVNRPYRMRSDLPELKGAINAMVEQIEKLYPDLPNSRWVALRLLDGDNSIAEALLKGELGNLMGSEDDEADQNLELQLEVVQ